jgi:hypothetical protein
MWLIWFSPFFNFHLPVLCLLLTIKGQWLIQKVPVPGLIDTWSEVTRTPGRRVVGISRLCVVGSILVMSHQAGRWFAYLVFFFFVGRYVFPFSILFYLFDPLLSCNVQNEERAACPVLHHISGECGVDDGRHHTARHLRQQPQLLTVFH